MDNGILSLTVEGAKDSRNMKAVQRLDLRVGKGQTGGEREEKNIFGRERQHV